MSTVERPTFREAQCFAVWLAINEPQLITYFVALTPEVRGDDFLNFARGVFTQELPT